MPLQFEEKKRRGRPLAWLGLAGVLAVLLALPLAPFVRPIFWFLGSNLLIVQAGHGQPYFANDTLLLQTHARLTINEKSWTVMGGFHRVFRGGGWCYEISWLTVKRYLTLPRPPVARTPEELAGLSVLETQYARWDAAVSKGRWTEFKTILDPRFTWINDGDPVPTAEVDKNLKIMLFSEGTARHTTRIDRVEITPEGLVARVTQREVMRDGTVTWYWKHTWVKTDAGWKLRRQADIPAPPGE